jgi:hypothetical protein
LAFAFAFRGAADENEQKPIPGFGPRQKDGSVTARRNITNCDILDFVAWPSTIGRGSVSVAIKSLLSLLLLLLLFEGMLTAFHLLNLPSNLAVLGGTLLLVALAVVALFAFRGIWNRRWG